MDTLPIEIQEDIYRKKFNLELKEWLMEIGKKWFPSIKEVKFNHLPIKVGDFVEVRRCTQMDIYGRVEKITTKQYFIGGKGYKKENTKHDFLHTLRYLDRLDTSQYLFDSGSLFSHPIALKYPELEGVREAKSILLGRSVPMCNDPFAWLWFEVNRPELESKKETSRNLRK